MSSSPSAWADSNYAAEQSRHMRLIGEATIKRNLCKWKVCLQHQFLDPFDSAVDEIAMGCYADCRSKGTCKVADTEAREVCEIPRSDFVAQIGIDESPYPRDLPRRQSASAKAGFATGIVFPEI